MLYSNCKFENKTAVRLYHQDYGLLILYTCSNFLEFHTWEPRFSVVKELYSLKTMGGKI